VNVNRQWTVTFFARLAAGAHINVGSSLQIDVASIHGQLQIHKPQPGAGAPTSAVVKTGPRSSQGGMVNYTLTYTNKATTPTSVWACKSHILPPQVTVATNLLPEMRIFGNTFL